MVPSNEAVLDIPPADAPKIKFEFKQLPAVFKHETADEHTSVIGDLRELYNDAHTPTTDPGRVPGSVAAFAPLSDSSNLIVGTKKLALFRAVNKGMDDDNILDLAELEDALRNHEFLDFVGELGIDLKQTADTADSARRVFKCLDKNNSGDVTMNEFLQGLERLGRGVISVQASTSKQLKSVKKQNKSMKTQKSGYNVPKTESVPMISIQDGIRATKKAKAFAGLPDWCQRIDATRLTRILEAANVMNHVDTNKNGIINVAKVMGNMALDESGEIHIEEYLNALLSPHRKYGLQGQAGDVVLHCSMTTESPGTEIIYTLVTPDSPENTRPSLRNKRVHVPGEVLSQTRIHAGGHQIKVNAIAIGACLPSPMSTKEITVPSLHNPDIQVRPLSGTLMEVKLTSFTPNTEMFYTVDNKFPSKQSKKYSGKVTRMPFKAGAGVLRVRARAYLGDLCSGVSELSFDLEGFGLADIERKGDHTFTLASAGLWISMGDSVKIDSVHQALQDEQMIKEGMASEWHIFSIAPFGQQCAQHYHLRCVLHPAHSGAAC